MSKGIPSRAKVGDRGNAVIEPATYFLAKRMEKAGRLRPGGALMLAIGLGVRSKSALKPTNDSKKGRSK